MADTTTGSATQTDTSNSKTNTISQILAENIDKLIKSRIKDASFDKTYVGIITALKFDKDTKTDDKNYLKYAVKYNEIERDFYIKDGKFHAIGEIVRVHIPKNVLTARYIECTGLNSKAGHPIKTEYNDSEDTITESWCTNLEKLNDANENNGEISDDYIITRQYTLEIKNKGEEDEEVTALIYPDGSRMELVGF